VTVIELVLAALLAAGGVRSLWRWTHRRLDGADVVDHLLYALHVTGRIGLWFAFAGFFVLSALMRADGYSSREAAQLRAYVLVPIVLAAAQLLAGYALGRRASDA
jgi:hypothetical protein